MIWTRALLFVTVMIAIAGTANGNEADIGQVKVVNGDVVVEREGTAQPAVPGLRVRASDVVRTSAGASVGITMNDDSRLSLGSNSTMSLDRFAFDPATHAGRFDASLRKGTLAVVSGRIAKQSPDAMTVRTPSTVLGVRGTEFAVSVHDVAIGFVR